ncbi:LysR family transcriptional regulator [Neisseria animaloris]|uniref:LysR family transcriptional regulator n=1 Tax=Neisseria animaloris TaxID=326522 RepID=A0A448UC00_9NEIS|nr:LysR family transcriptional regulator [Neisseria animaloris]VEJ21423.1 LysR family transcriptional regulator [Neisseria animaloris]
MMDKLTAVKVFLAVAESGSFTAAAEKLEMSKAMVSRHIALMEQWLNARLLQRTTRHVGLTAAGEQALRYCRQINELAEDAVWEIAPADGELRGVLRLTASTSFGICHLAQAVAGFGRQHPKLSIHLHVGDETVNLVESGIDLAVRISSSPDSSLIARPLSPCRSLLVASPDYLAAYGIPQHPDDLHQHRCLAHTNLNRSEWHFSNGGERHSLTLNNTVAGNDASVLLQTALNGAGIAMLPRYMLGKHLEQGTLQAVLPQWTLPEMTIYALYPSRRQLSRPVRLFLDFLVDYCADRDW